MNKDDPAVQLELRRMELEIKLKEVELPIELAKLGLRGTLTGAIVGCFVVVALAVLGASSERIQITGTHLCIMMGILAVAVALYGGFVFQRSVLITGRWRDRGVSVGTGETNFTNRGAEPDQPNPQLNKDAR